MSARYAGFEQRTFRFLGELAGNNDREWFKANKARYETDVLDVALRFINSMQAPLEEIAPHFVAQATRVGGSLMRVYRDTRFSKDKTPYKTNIGIQFRHEQAKDVHAPGFYVHIAAEECFVGAGMWMPESAALRHIRERVAARPSDWLSATGGRTFRKHFELGGTSLKRAPRGFDVDHALIDVIKRKSFIAVRHFEPDDCLRPQFQRAVENSFRTATPLMQFLCKAVGVPF